MFPLFTDYFALKAKGAAFAIPALTAAVTAAALCAASQNLAFPVLVSVFCLGSMFFHPAPFSYILPRLAAPMAMAGILFLLKLFLTPGEVWWQIYPLTATIEGASGGMLAAARVAGAMSAVLLLGLCVPAHSLFTAMGRMGMPSSVSETGMGVYRYIFLLIESAGSMISARRLRLGYRNFRQAASSAGVVAGAVFLRAADQAETSRLAMQARGYRGGELLPPAGRPGRGELLLSVVAGAGIFLLYLALGAAE